MPNEDLELRFAQALERSRLLPRGAAVLAGVSGGADSVGLLYLLCALNRDGWDLRIHVAHLNHLLRGADSHGDAEFVRRLAEDLGLPSTITSIDINQTASDQGISIEQAARQRRFDFFERLCLRLEMKIVVLAHHADDNAETILHRIVRGTGLRGLAGIRPMRPIRAGSDIRVVRPLLTIRRSEIEDYLNERQIAFRHDLTNDHGSYTRNRIRNEVLPILRDRVNPQVIEALNRLGEQARGVDDYLKATAERMLDSMIVERGPGQLVLYRPALARKARVIQMQLIREAMLWLGVGEAEITYGHFNAIADMTEDSEGSSSLDLPDGLRVIRRYDRLSFERSGSDAAEMGPPAETPVAVGATTPLPAQGMELGVEIITADRDLIVEHMHHMAGRSQFCHEEWIDAEQIHPPLIARSRRPGDRFFPLGMNGMKKLSDFFIDEKIDADTRERTVVLCDRLGPVWIVPLRIDDRVRLTEATRQVMRLVAREVPAASQ